MIGLKSSKYYSLEVKLEAVHLVRTGQLTMEQVSRKFGIKGHTTVAKWMRKFEQIETDPMKEQDEESYLKRIRDLTEALEREKMKRIAYEEMIKLAEKELQIDIRKKSNTKQSED